MSCPKCRGTMGPVSDTCLDCGYEEGLLSWVFSRFRRRTDEVEQEIQRCLENMRKASDSMKKFGQTCDELLASLDPEGIVE